MIKLTSTVIVLVLSALAGGIAAIVLNEINKSTATTQTADTTIGNLYNTDGTINAANVSALLSKIGYSGSALSTPKDSQEIVSGQSSYVFQMGYYVDANGNMDTSKPLEWEAVYMWGEY